MSAARRTAPSAPPSARRMRGERGDEHGRRALARQAARRRRRPASRRSRLTAMIARQSPIDGDRPTTWARARDPPSSSAARASPSTARGIGDVAGADPQVMALDLSVSATRARWASSRSAISRRWPRPSRRAMARPMPPAPTTTASGRSGRALVPTAGRSSVMSEGWRRRRARRQREFDRSAELSVASSCCRSRPRLTSSATTSKESRTARCCRPA